jgi:hypothetical protein
MGELITTDANTTVNSNIDYDFLGTEYYYANYNPSGGYKACKTVVYHLFLNTDRYHQSLTPDIPQVDINEQLLFIHLYNGDEQFNIVNADSIKITFECNGKTVEGDPERLDLYNPYRGTFTYIMNKNETQYVGLNTMTITVTIGSETANFVTCYNVVANVTIGNIDGTTYEGMTLQDLIDLIKNHIEDKTIHCDDYKNLNIYNAFITVDTYEDLDTIDKTLLIDGKMFRVNSPTVTYYYYDTQSNTFKPLLFDNVVFDDTSLLSNYLAQTKYYYEQAQDILSQVQQIKQEIEELRS